jgi:predicted nucleotidyltransferase
MVLRMRYDPLDFILSSPARVRVLRALLPLTRPVSGREAARLAGVSPRVIERLDDLVESGILIRREGAGQHLYTVNEEHALYPALSGLFREEDRWSEDLSEALLEVLNPLRPAAVASIGSTARGEAGPGSDFDLLVLVENQGAAEDAHEALAAAAPRLQLRFGIALSPVVSTVAHWRQMVREADDFAQSAATDAIVLAGDSSLIRSHDPSR